MNKENIELFNENGYLVVPGFLSSNDIESLKDEIRKLHKLFLEKESKLIPEKNVFVGNSKQDQVSKNYFLDSADRITFFFEQKADSIDNPLWKINKVGHALHDKSEAFKKVSFRKSIRDMCIDLMNFRDPTIVQSMYIFKPPHIGGEVQPHQDESYIAVTPKDKSDTSCIGFWFALEDADKENACLWAIPGSHKVPILKQWVRIEQENNSNDELPLKFVTVNPNNPYFTEEQALNYVPLEVKAGDLVILHGRVAHKSEDNISTRSREAYTLHIVDREEYSELNWLQRQDNFPSYWETI